jgi:hypothetical protein
MPHFEPTVSTERPAGLQRVADALAAAGYPHGVFRLSPAELQSLTGAPVHDVTESLTTS